MIELIAFALFQPIATLSEDPPVNVSDPTSLQPDDSDCNLLIDTPSAAPVLESKAPLPTPREIPLSELVVDLENIKPSHHPPKVIMDDAHGLKVVLHYALDRPRDDVAVIVVITTNQSAEPVRSYQLDASVSKVSKILFPKYNLIPHNSI